MNKNNYIECAILVHGNRYDYSLSNYVNNKTKIKIICEVHGIFEQTPLTHIYFKCNCPKCSKCQNINTEKYIEMAIKKHETKFDYSLVHYINMHTKIKIKCDDHGIFEQTPLNHLNYGCKKCSFKKNRISELYLFDRFNKVHENKYNYSISIYETMHIKIKIKCTGHGIFEQSPANHLGGKGCPKCSKNHKKDSNFIINELNDIHENKYLYKDEFDRTSDKIIIFCEKHGNFLQTLNNHLSGHGCPSCCSSNGEKQISKILKEKNIQFIKQKKFKGCKDKNELPFDFYLPEHNICIEFDGIQHFKPIERWGGEENYKIILDHDNKKNDFCNKEKIELMRISYLDDIKDILNFKF